MRALDARHVHKARRAADQRAAREHEGWDGLPAALGDRARAIGDALAAFEERADLGMLLEALELVEGREERVLVIEMNDEADRHEPLAEMIHEGAAAGPVVERPAQSVHDQAGLMLLGR